MGNQKDGFLRRAGKTLGFVVEGPSEVRSELPVAGGSVLPPPRLDNSTVITADRALSLAAVYRAVSILGISVSQLPVYVLRGGDKIEIPALIKQPNANLSRRVFLEQTTNCLALTGNAYWLLRRQSATSPVVNMEVLNPNFMTIEENKGKTLYHYNGKVYQSWQIKHLQLMRVPGLNVGVGPIQAAQNELRGAIDLRNYAENWFREGGVPNGILNSDQYLTPEQADAYKTRWAETQAQRGVAVMGQGLSYQPVYLSPKDAMFIESQDFSIQQIARMFGIPPTYLIADANNSMTYVNQESVDIQFIRYTVMSYFSEIEDALTDVLPRGQQAKFNVEGLLRADTATRYSAYKTAIDAGFMTVNEVREKEDMPPLMANTQEEGNPA